MGECAQSAESPTDQRQGTAAAAAAGAAGEEGEDASAPQRILDSITILLTRPLQISGLWMFFVS